MTTYKEKLKYVLRESINKVLMMEQGRMGPFPDAEPVDEPEELEKEGGIGPNDNITWAREHPDATVMEFLVANGVKAAHVIVPKVQSTLRLRWPVIQSIANIFGGIFGTKPTDLGTLVIREGATHAKKDAAIQHNVMLDSALTNQPGEEDEMIKREFENGEPG